MRTHLTPIVETKSFVDNCSECGSEHKFFLELLTIDWEKSEITMKFYCNSCKDSGWRKIIISHFKT